MTSVRSRLWVLTLLVISSILLASCGGSSNSSSNHSNNDRAVDREPEPDPAIPEPEAIIVSKSLKPGIRDGIEVVFNEPMNPSSLELEGMLAEIAARPEWSDDNQKVTLRPAEGAWESGRHIILGSLQSAAGAPVSLTLEVEIRLVFETFQEASFVIGQPDFESGDASSTPTVNTLVEPIGMPAVSGGRLWIPDPGNHRLLGFDGIPSNNQPDATWVAGQADFESNTSGTSATAFATPLMGLEHQDRFYMLEFDNNRVSIFDQIPPIQASAVIGQNNLDSSSATCSPTSLYSPAGMFIVDDMLLVADSGNNRVLIWNSVPKDISGQAADLVLGQATMDICEANDDDQDQRRDRQPTARTFDFPAGVWSDGKRLIVADMLNYRVLIWNSFPSDSFVPADLVVGNPDFSGPNWYAPADRSLSDPYGVWSNGLQLFVADMESGRILIWDEFPTENGQPADKVLGHPGLDDFEWSDSPSARAFSSPGGIIAHRDKLIVMDIAFNRALIFEAQ